MSNAKTRHSNIFVTVGTTLFDPLVQVTSNKKFIDIVSSRFYNHLTIQYGKGKHEPFQTESVDDRCVTKKSVQCESYRFKSSLDQDMSKANLIISHAGAGSIMEGLLQCKSRSNAKLIVVINSRLMNNHQQELAGALESRGHLICLLEPELLLQESTWEDKIDNWIGKPFPGGDGGADFAELVDDCLGF